MFDGQPSVRCPDAPFGVVPSLRPPAPARLGCLRAVVLAGVHSWGCSELERVVPRLMMPVVGRPLVGHCLAWLRDGGISRVGICANSDTPVLRRWLRAGSELRLEVDYYEDVMPRGPAGCMCDAMAFDDAEHFLVVDGTLVPRLDLARIVSFHLESGSALTVVAEPSGVSEKGERRLAPVGVYVCARRVLEHIPERGYQDIKESLIPKLRSAGERVTACVVEAGSAPRVNSLASYLAVSKWELTRLVSREVCSADYVVRGQAWIHRSARVATSARFVGPVLVEAGSGVDEGAIVVGPTVVGPGCRLETGATVCRSVLWSDCLVEQGARLDHCVLADGAVVAAGADVRNRACLASPRLWSFASGTYPRWSWGALLADDKPVSIEGGCEGPVTPAVSVPADQLVGVSPASGRARSGPSRRTSPVRMQSHGG